MEILNFGIKMRKILIYMLYVLNDAVCSSAISLKTYEVLKGVKMLNTYYTVSLNHNSTNKCASYCLADNVCVSANYNFVTKQCQLSTKSPLDESASVVEDNEWKVLFSKKDLPPNSWELIFRGTPGTGVKLYDSYVGTVSLPTHEVGCQLPVTHNLTCTTHYRDPILDIWSSQSILKVKVAMYKDNVMVMNMVFNNTDTGLNTDWYSQDQLIYSSYTDMTTVGITYNFFSIKGDEPIGRRFYINKNYGGCAVDVGWVAVFDFDPGCTYGNGLQYPAFAYMPNNIMGQWDLKTFQLADALAIYIQK
ncbi:uncharacterized protein LOC134709575 [Mytilus trossulus]|uniref:uncharacterized protein LOC134709575 n=1 Tax=Mytilus trossulus TaxID=6551 RepID=UPI0030056FCE